MFWILVNTVENIKDDAILDGSLSSIYDFKIPFNIGKALSEGLTKDTMEIHIEKNALRGRMTDHLIFGEIPCSTFSEKTREVFHNFQVSNIQYIPVLIIDKFTNADDVSLANIKGDKLDYNTVNYDGFSIANVLGLVDCVDHEASDLEYYMPKQDVPDDMPENMKAALQQEVDNDIDFIRKLVLDDDKIPQDIKIFRLKDCPRILVFKEEIVNAIKEAKLTGFVFVPLEKYTDEIPDDDTEEETETVAEKVAKTPAKAEPELPKTGKGIVIKGIKNN